MSRIVIDKERVLSDGARIPAQVHRREGIRIGFGEVLGGGTVIAIAYGLWQLAQMPPECYVGLFRVVCK